MRLRVTGVARARVTRCLVILHHVLRRYSTPCCSLLVPRHYSSRQQGCGHVIVRATKNLSHIYIWFERLTAAGWLNLVCFRTCFRICPYQTIIQVKKNGKGILWCTKKTKVALAPPSKNLNNTPPKKQQQQKKPNKNKTYQTLKSKSTKGNKNENSFCKFQCKVLNLC